MTAEAIVRAVVQMFTTTARRNTSLVNRDDWRLTWHHIECGLHSGFPPCCIAYFITARWTQSAFDAAYQEYEAKLFEAWKELHPGSRLRRAGFGYVPCPDCVRKRRFVRVKRCGCASRKRRIGEKRR